MSDSSQPPGLLVLGIDTSGADGSLALARVSEGAADAALSAERTITGRNYSAELLPALKQLLSQSGVAISDLSAIVIITGPGSFTGLRIGISTAKALAQAASIPIIAVSKLQVMRGRSQKDPVTVLDAGRNEYYVSIPVPETNPSLETLESHAALTEKIQDQQILICEPQLVDRLAALHPVLVRSPTAFDAILHAQPHLLAHAFDDLATLDANYVRRPYQQATTAVTADSNPKPSAP